VQLRLIEERDLEAVRALRNSNRRWFFDDREVTPAQHRRWFEALAGGPTRFYVMEEDGEVVGTISLKALADGTELGHVIVSAGRRGRGLARLAIERLTASPGTYLVDVRAGNQAAIALYERTGFSRERRGLPLEHVVLVKRVTVGRSIAGDGT
jgi:RimJ/RimL family protein N-acetyltransferase